MMSVHQGYLCDAFIPLIYVMEKHHLEMMSLVFSIWRPTAMLPWVC